MSDLHLQLDLTERAISSLLQRFEEQTGRQVVGICLEQIRSQRIADPVATIIRIPRLALQEPEPVYVWADAQLELTDAKRVSDGVDIDRVHRRESA